MPERDELDLLIDSALADYAEPRAGLEQRIVARVHAGSSTSTTGWRWALWALACTLAIACVISIAIPRERRSPPASTATATTPVHVAPSPRQTKEPQPQVRLRQQPAERLVSRAGSHRRNEQVEAPSQPKLDLFPAPQPLSSQERALIALVTRAPAEAARLGLENREQADAPLQISQIEVPPITVPEEGKH